MWRAATVRKGSHQDFHERIPMSDIINLRRARKAKKRDEADKTAAANRLSFGRSKAEKQGAAAEDARVKAKLDGHALEKEE